MMQAGKMPPDKKRGAYVLFT